MKKVLADLSSASGSGVILDSAVVEKKDGATHSSSEVSVDSGPHDGAQIP